MMNYSMRNVSVISFCLDYRFGKVDGPIASDLVVVSATGLLLEAVIQALRACTTGTSEASLGVCS